MSDYVFITPGTGGTGGTVAVAADRITSGGVDYIYQRVKPVTGRDGSPPDDVSDIDPLPIYTDSRPAYFVTSGKTAMVNVASTIHFDLFNAAGSGVTVRVTQLRMQLVPTITTVTGVINDWQIVRTSTVGTGGTSRTIVKTNTGYQNVPAGLTARTKPTGGASTSEVLLEPSTTFEESTQGAAFAAISQDLNWLPRPVDLIEGQGLKIVQVVASAIGFVNHVLCIEFL